MVVGSCGIYPGGSNPAPRATEATGMAARTGTAQAARRTSEQARRSVQGAAPHLTVRRLRVADRARRGIRTRQSSTKKPTHTMMAITPPRLTLELSRHQCPKWDLQAVLAVVPSLLDSLTLCRLVVKSPPLLVMAACRGGCRQARGLESGQGRGRGVHSQPCRVLWLWLGSFLRHAMEQQLLLHGSQGAWSAGQEGEPPPRGRSGRRRPGGSSSGRRGWWCPAP